MMSPLITIDAKLASRLAASALDAAGHVPVVVTVNLGKRSQVAVTFDAMEPNAAGTFLVRPVLVDGERIATLTRLPNYRWRLDAVDAPAARPWLNVAVLKGKVVRAESVLTAVRHDAARRWGKTVEDWKRETDR